jgi:hypothetical protein
MLEAQNKNRPDKQKVKINDFIKISAENATLELLKQGMIRSIVAQMPDRSNDPFVKLYASTVGLGEKSGSDWYKIADENINAAINYGIVLALATLCLIL